MGLQMSSALAVALQASHRPCHLNRHSRTGHELHVCQVRFSSNDHHRCSFTPSLSSLFPSASNFLPSSLVPLATVAFCRECFWFSAEWSWSRVASLRPGFPFEIIYSQWQRVITTVEKVRRNSVIQPGSCVRFGIDSRAAATLIPEKEAPVNLMFCQSSLIKSMVYALIWEWLTSFTATSPRSTALVVMVLCPSRTGSRTVESLISHSCSWTSRGLIHAVIRTVMYTRSFKNNTVLLLTTRDAGN